MSGRWLLMYGAILAVIAAAAWLQAEGMPPLSRSALPECGRFYAVDLSGAHPVIDLEFDGDSRYELIVSSLGNELQTYPVRLEAHAYRRAELFSAVPVNALAPRMDGWRGQSDAFKPCVRSRPPDKAEPCAQSGAAERRFFVHVTADPLEDERSYVPVTGILSGEGNQVRVYVDRGMPAAALAPGLIDEIIRLLDDEIIIRSLAIIGRHADVDGDGKLAVIVTNWLGRLRGGTTSLDGFVRSNDFQADVDIPFGNHADVIYVNAALQPGPALKTLLAHEYTHAVCFSQRLADAPRRAPLPVEEDWLNEALAHVAEKLHGGDWSNLDRRIAEFLSRPQKSPLAVRDYYRAGLWRDPGCRGAAFLFLQFCVDRFGECLLRDLVSSPCSGKGNLERATQKRFAELFRHWTMALSEGRLASVPLVGKLGNCELSGPARLAWTADGDPCLFDLYGTATAFIDLTNAGRTGVVRLSIAAQPQARLQLTLVRYTSARK